MEKEQATQGQYVVSDTRCPTLHDCEFEVGEARQRSCRTQGASICPSVCLFVDLRSEGAYSKSMRPEKVNLKQVG